MTLDGLSLTASVSAYPSLLCPIRRFTNARIDISLARIFFYECADFLLSMRVIKSADLMSVNDLTIFAIP